MSSYDDCTLSSSNAFSPSFLHRIGQRDEPPSAGEADVAGPWRILEMPGKRFGVSRLGESRRGHRPAAAFGERCWLCWQRRSFQAPGGTRRSGFTRRLAGRVRGRDRQRRRAGREPGAL
ncbi:MAG: hypothetical protein DMF53_00975 [Acidobacteria bacterium]|nr:MAG: hypothetical protein DMF53_00975 [Acidobacteriota bacterium]